MFLSCLVALAWPIDLKTEPIELSTPTGTLYGTLDLPSSPGPWPIVLIHAGSGPTDRDGNQRMLKNDSLKQLGQALAAEGIATLRIDKRGIAASAKAMAREEDIRFSHYAADVVAWLKKLQADHRFNRFAVIGHSEGSMIGTLAAQQIKLDAFVSLCGPGRKLSVIIREQLGKNAKQLVPEADKIMKSLEEGQLYPEPSKSMAALFRPSVQPYLIELFRFDPAKELGKLDCPVLIVSGSVDIQIPVEDGELLQKALPTAGRVVIKNLSHVLKETELTASLLQQLAVYNNSKAPLHPQLVPELLKFFNPLFSKK